MNDDDYDCRILDEASMVRSPAERPSRNSPQATVHSTTSRLHKLYPAEYKIVGNHVKEMS